MRVKVESAIRPDHIESSILVALLSEQSKYVTIAIMTNAIYRTFVLTLLLAAAGAHAGSDPTFKKYKLSDQFYSEGCTAGDFNQDGTLDYAAGPFWYEGPSFEKKHTIYEPKPIDPNGYSKNFLAFSYDFNGDGWTDIFTVGFPGDESPWFENPRGKDEPWKRRVAVKITDNESPRFGDLTGDGKPELIFHTGGLLGWAEPNAAEPDKEWTFHKISHKPDNRFQRFTHGLGYGDVNSDGKIDLLELKGWWEQPASLNGDPEWTFHPVDFGGGGAQMYTYDVDADGDADVITSVRAHEYGLAWFENKIEGGVITFARHLILSDKAEEKTHGVQFSQLHAVALFDMNNDGIKDIVTGKRYWAHGPKGDPEPAAAPVVYWFELSREGGQVKYTPHKIDDDSGVGTQVVATDMNGDGLGDVLVGNKHGQYVFIQEPAK
jgi:hypothetical protein